MSSNPMPITRPRGPPSATSSNSSQSGSASNSVRSTLSTPPRSAMSLSSRHSLTMSLTNHGHAPLNLGSTHHHHHLRQHSNSNDGDIPFLGTPFAFALERPYEYPFPSPATESCPNLAATSAAMGSMGLGLVHIPPPTAFVQSPTQTQSSALPSVLPPPPSPSVIPSSPGMGPFTARMPLRRRASYATGGPAGLPSPPVPPSLTIKARELNRRTSINGRNTTQR